MNKWMDETHFRTFSATQICPLNAVVDVIRFVFSFRKKNKNNKALDQNKSQRLSNEKMAIFCFQK